LLEISTIYIFDPGHRLAWVPTVQEMFLSDGPPTKLRRMYRDTQGPMSDVQRRRMSSYQSSQAFACSQMSLRPILRTRP